METMVSTYFKSLVSTLWNKGVGSAYRSPWQKNRRSISKSISKCSQAVYKGLFIVVDVD